MIRREPGANILDTIARVKAVLPTLSSSISPSITMEVVLDRSGTIRASVNDVELALVISIVLVILVVLSFLRSPIPVRNLRGHVPARLQLG